MRLNNRILVVPIMALVLMACSGGEQDPSGASDPIRDWPRTLEHDGHRILVYEPQLESWSDFDVLEASSALLIQPAGDRPPMVGGLVWAADTETDFDERTVIGRNVRVMEITFPGLDEPQIDHLRSLIEESFPTETVPVPLDLVLAQLDREEAAVQPVEVNLAPPPIFVSQEPAILLQFMGEPRFEAIAGPGLMLGVNASWDVFYIPGTSAYYLRLGDSWLASPDAVEGPWSPVKELPEAIRLLPTSEDWRDLASAIPGKRLDPVPAVFTSTSPAELIEIEGKPQFSPIPGTSLMVVANTTSKLFFDTNEDNYYFLAAGRWFLAAELTATWEPATNDLPVDFQRIPEDHGSADVLASVPGTRDAEEAVIAASIPRKAEVRRDSATLDVTYDGEPETVLIKDTTVYYVVNTPYDVFLVDGTYYACHEGIWFTAVGPRGPWLVADVVPAALYTIPSTSPKHNVTYVRVYDSTPDTVVVGYTSGYHGMYVARGVVMLGLGIWAWNELWDDHWDHHHHHHHYHHYHYHPHYYGYGGGTWYDPHSGHYRREFHGYGPYGSAHGAARYNPHTGGWARGASVSGPYAARGVAEGYNPRTGTYFATRQGSNPYGSWGESVVSRGGDWVHTARRTDASGTRRVFETSEGTRGATYRGREGTASVVRKDGDLYVGRDGNVYKRETGSGWQRHSGNGRWESVERDARTARTDAASSRVARDATAADRVREARGAAGAGQRTDGARESLQARTRDSERTVGDREAGSRRAARGDATPIRERADRGDAASRAGARTDSNSQAKTPSQLDRRASRDSRRATTPSRESSDRYRASPQRATRPDRSRVLDGLDRDARARQRGREQAERHRSGRAGGRSGGRRR